MWFDLKWSAESNAGVPNLTFRCILAKKNNNKTDTFLLNPEFLFLGQILIKMTFLFEVGVSIILGFNISFSIFSKKSKNEVKAITITLNEVDVNPG